jgi:hypothetical protein
MSNDVFSSFSSHIGRNKGCENVVASFTMIGFLLMSTKNKRVTLKNKYNFYIQRKFHAYILEIKVRIMCNGASFDSRTI